MLISGSQVRREGGDDDPDGGARGSVRRRRQQGPAGTEAETGNGVQVHRRNSGNRRPHEGGDTLLSGKRWVA